MKRLKELREQKKMSQQALADILHVTQQSVYKYEHDLAVPDLDILICIAKYFNTSIDYLVGTTNSPIKYTDYDTNSLTNDELTIINYYRSLTPTAKALIKELIQEKEA